VSPAARTPHASRTRRAVVGAVAVLTVGMGLRSTVVPGHVHLWFNLGLVLCLLLLARSVSLTRSELGLDARELGRGLRWGGVVFGLITLVVGVAALLPATAGFFEDDRAEVGTSSFVLRAVFVIPVGTVLLEELAFRGVLLGLALRLTSTTRAVVSTSVLFGLWHVLTAWSSSGSNAALGEVAASTGGRLATVAGTVVATTLAGLAFTWLRLASRSLVAPMLAHVATNSVTFTAAWLLAR
jgi:uncharacterized protein